ncbi:putative reverse transcriptase domain, reverse transcriptase zinc-binding domain protein, partial [Tanacetum coccineum]
AMFSMGDDKSPGPDGYTVAFFKEAWEIIATDVTDAVREFFTNGKLLKELNHTIIALIPKIQSPLRVNDYRPISCCNVLFKCISKILANRIKHSLKYLVSPNQSAFVPGRSISDNILLTQELMHNYHLNRGTPRCAFKVDIQKAYHTVDWEFLRRILHGFGFHARIVSWIMECVSTTSYSICINGNLHGYFKGNRGLRQGDPLSLYLFTLIMEVLTLMLHRRVLDSGIFTYHMYCSRLDLINLCFADDLFIFTYGDVHSAGIIKEALDEFKNASGLTPSLPKSTAYFCNISMEDWKNKSLSIAGRLQLIASVIGSIHVYWALVFIIPLDHFNSALMVSHVWKLLTLKESLWVKWIHKYKLKGRIFWSKIGDGSQTSLWFDRWCDIGPLCYMISTRDMYRAGLTPLSKVKDIIYNGSWNWPVVLIEKYSFLSTCFVPIVNGSPDAIVCRSNIGDFKHFSVIQVLAGINILANDVYSIIDYLLPYAKRRTSRSVIAKLVVAASTYFIWQERNRRLFKNNKRTLNQVIDCIMSSVRLKLMSCKFKRSRDGETMARK